MRPCVLYSKQPLLLLVMAAWLAACASSRAPKTPDKKTDWLGSCDASDECRPGMECVQGVCTTRCADRNACAQYADDAICAPLPIASTCPGPVARASERACTLACERRSECGSRNEALLCIENACAADPCTRDEPAEGGEPDGAPTVDGASADDAAITKVRSNDADASTDAPIELTDADTVGLPDAEIGDGSSAQDVCASNVCLAAYPCQTRGTTYTCRGQFADWPAMDSPNAFVNAGDGTITDTRSGLTWQRVVEPIERDRAGAEAYCASLDLPGTGWRLPAITELESLIDFNRMSPLIDPSAFPDTPLGSYWSSSTLTSPANHNPWTVNFNSGLSHGGFPVDAAYVRCVRSDAELSASFGSGGVPPGRYTVNDETVYDAYTTLTWQRTIDETAYTQAEAIAHCSGLTLAGGGWRLPTISELLTIADRMKWLPALDQTIFVGPDVFGTSAALWSSTIGAMGEAWALNTADGSRANGSARSTPMGARCVR